MPPSDSAMQATWYSVSGSKLPRVKEMEAPVEVKMAKILGSRILRPSKDPGVAEHLPPQIGLLRSFGVFFQD